VGHIATGGSGDATSDVLGEQEITGCERVAIDVRTNFECTLR